MRPHLRGITASTMHESARHGPLRASAWVHRLGVAELELLLQGSRCCAFRRGDTLVLSGSRPSHALLLLAGHVKEHRPLEDGSRALSAFRGPGDLVAEIAILTHAPSEHDVTALGPVEALALDPGRLRDVASREPRVQEALLLAIARRATVAETTLVRNEVCDLSRRIMLAIVDLVDRWGIPTTQGTRIGLPLTQTELAEWVGASRESAAKVLQRLRRAEIVETSRRRLVVRDVARLRSLALDHADPPVLSIA